jgi:flagellar assembly factor FliW
MRIESPFLGQVEVSDDKIIDFPRGLPGFEHCKRFALVHDEGGESGLHLLQSLDEPALVLSVAGPELLGISYEFELQPEELSLLGLERAEDVAVAVILRREDGEPASPADTGMRANFMGPLVINSASRKGMQKIINRLGCEVILRERS